MRNQTLGIVGESGSGKSTLAAHGAAAGTAYCRPDLDQRRRYLVAARREPQGVAPAGSADLPESRLLVQSAPQHPRHPLGAARSAWHRHARRAARSHPWPAATGRVSTLESKRGCRTSFRAARSSASPSRAPSSWVRAWCLPTSRPRLSMFPSRPRCSKLFSDIKARFWSHHHLRQPQSGGDPPSQRPSRGHAPRRGSGAGRCRSDLRRRRNIAYTRELLAAVPSPEIMRRAG